MKVAEFSLDDKIMRDITKSKFDFEKAVFISFLLLIAWVPLPLASNRFWALSIIEVWVFLLCIVLCLAYLQGKLKISPVLIKAKPAIILLISWLVILFLQILPLPPSLIEFISPERFESYNSLGPFISLNGQWLSLTENTSVSVQYIIKSISYALIFGLSLQLINTRNRVKLLALTIVYCALFQAMYASLMTLSGIEYGFFIKKETGIGVATGTFVNRNHLAGYLNMGIAVTLGLLISKLRMEGSASSYKQWYRKIVQLLLSKKATLRIYVVLMTVTLVLTHSRMGNATIIISLTLASMLSLFLTRHARKTMVILTISIIVIDISIISSWYGLEKVVSRIEQTAPPRIEQILPPQIEQTSEPRIKQSLPPLIKQTLTPLIEQTSHKAEVRYEVFSYTMNQINDYFYFGSGGGTYKYIFPKYREGDIKLYFDHAHNDFLEIASEAGVIGLSLLASLVLMTLFTGIKALSLRRDPLMIGMAFSSIMGVLAISIHSLVDFNLQIPANAVTFIVLLSLSWIARYKLNHHSGKEIT